MQQQDLPQLRKRDYVVMPVGLSVAQGLIRKHHYARGGSSGVVFAHGLFRKDRLLECLGVAWWIPPPGRTSVARVWNGDFREVLSLSRLVIAPGVPSNACSFLVGESIKRIRQDGRFRCLMTYADEMQGHTGQIYRATNWEYLGLTDPQPAYRDPKTGRLVSRKTWTGGRSKGEMTRLGYELVGYYRKHIFRMVLPPPRQKPEQQRFAL